MPNCSKKQPVITAIVNLCFLSLSITASLSCLDTDTIFCTKFDAFSNGKLFFLSGYCLICDLVKLK